MMKTVGFLLLCFSAFAFAEENVKSACQEDRESRLTATTPSSLLHLIPECDENGDYAAKQCYTGTGWCVCYRRNGENINTPSKSIKACDCDRARDDAISAGADYKPTCSKDGYYRPKQCKKGGECFCVDKISGKAISDPTTGNVSC